MKHVLFIDDDEVTLKLYENALTRLGFHVTCVADGIRASQALISAKPDIVVLDLMMPNFNGVDVLRFIRTNAAIKELPVIVLTNAYLTGLADKAIALGVQKAALKAQCSPNQLAMLITKIFEEGPNQLKVLSPTTPETPTAASATPPHLAKPVPPPPPAPPVPTVQPTTHQPAPTASVALPSAPPKSSDEMHKTVVRTNLLANATKIRSDLHSLHQEFVRAQTESERKVRLQNLYRRVHFLSTSAGMAGCNRIALLSCAFEALLFELMNQPPLITPSTRVTVAMANDFLRQLLDRAKEVEATSTSTPRALIVDDDPLANRLISSALRYDQMSVRTTEDPVTALEWAKETHYDLFLLDIEMPGMDGFELCKQLRALPEYNGTPIIFVTSHADFEHRAKSILSGSNDLISKPVFPIELAVKAVTHLLRSGLESSAAA